MDVSDADSEDPDKSFFLDQNIGRPHLVKSPHISMQFDTVVSHLDEFLTKLGIQCTQNESKGKINIYHQSMCFTKT